MLLFKDFGPARASDHELVFVYEILQNKSGRFRIGNVGLVFVAVPDRTGPAGSPGWSDGPVESLNAPAARAQFCYRYISVSVHLSAHL